jgi:hypothetical protein
LRLYKDTRLGKAAAAAAASAGGNANASAKTSSGGNGAESKLVKDLQAQLKQAQKKLEDQEKSLGFPEDDEEDAEGSVALLTSSGESKAELQKQLALHEVDITVVSGQLKISPNEQLYKTRLADFKKSREDVKSKLRDLDDPETQLRNKENRASALKAIMAKAGKAIMADAVVLEDLDQEVVDVKQRMDENQTKIDESTVSLAQIRSEQRIQLEAATGTGKTSPADIAKLPKPVKGGTPPLETTLPPGSTAATGGGGTEGKPPTPPTIQVDDDAGVQPGRGSASSAGPTTRSKSAPATAKGKKKASECTLEEISQQIKQRKLVGKQCPVNMED